MSQIDEIIDLKQFIYKIIKNWFFILISLVIMMIVAFGYNRYSHEYYLSEASILIKHDNNTINAKDLLYENRFSNKKQSLENKKLSLKSYPLILKTITELNFDIAYYIVGNIMVSETFHAPVIVNCQNTNSLIGKSFSIELINKDSFKLIDEDNNESIYNFGEVFIFKNAQMHVILNQKYNAKFEDKPKTIVRFKHLPSLARSYQNKLKISQKDRESTVINLSILEEDQLKGVKFLNKLTQNFIASEIEEKNIASINTVNFINNQLQNMSDSLSLIEQKIQDYKNKNKITDLSLKAQNIYNNIVSLENELSKSLSKSNYYDYLIEYLKKENDFENISAPSSLSIEDISINKLIEQLIEIQISKNILLDGGQINNPAIQQYNRETKQIVLNLKENINTSKSANNLYINDLKERISRMENGLSDIPQVERELMSIERLQSISENIYIFLLKKRAEAKITSSANISDSKILEPALYSLKSPVFPNKNKTYAISILIAILIPIIIMFLFELFNDNVVTLNDLARMTSIPILGIIGRNYSGYNLLSDQNPKSAIYEGFRAIRSNLNFFNKVHDKTNNKTYLVTSSVSGEGKTYISENLAIVFAKSGKRTLLVGGDLRRPKIYADFNLSNVAGISNYLEDKSTINEVINKSQIENLDILVSGPLPKNPSDALLSKKFNDLFNDLKKRYDIIILDTPPLGLVADALTLMKFSDFNIYVTRQNYTKKGLLSYVNEMYKKHRLGEIQMVLNDVKDGSGAYGYGSYGYGSYGYGSYGYGYSYNDSSKYFDKDD